MMPKKMVLTGRRPKVTPCENCDIRYAYMMERRAEAVIDSFLLISTKKADRQAREVAERSLALQFDTSSDPVPCPECGWYQKDMVQSQRDKWQVVIMALVCFAGILAAVVYIWLNGYPWPAPYPLTLAYTLGNLGMFVGSLLSLFLIGSALSTVLAKYSNLNRGHPGLGRKHPERAASSRGTLVSPTDPQTELNPKDSPIEYDPTRTKALTPRTCLTDQQSDMPDLHEKELEVADVVAARNRVIEYLVARRNGAPVDEAFARQSLNQMGLCSIDLAEVLLALVKEQGWSAQHVFDFLACGDPGSKQEALLFKRVLTLGDGTFDPKLRYVLLTTGIVGDGSELASFFPEYDSVDALDRLCCSVSNWCASCA